MHILMTFPYSVGTPGGGTYALLQTAYHLKAAGVDITVFYLESGGLKLLFRKPIPPSRASGRQVEELRERGIDVVSVPVSRLSYALDGFFMRNAVADFVRKNQVDVILSWHHEAAFLAKICKTNVIPFICRASGNYRLIAKNQRGRIWSAITTHLLRWSMTKADAVWTPSSFTRSEAIDVFNLDPDKVKIIPEGINPIFLKARRERGGNQSITRFLYFGLWTESKGIIDALTAFGKVAAQGLDDWQLRIAGWGNDEIVRQAIQENNLTRQVKVLGKLDHPSLVRALEWAQVAILPSKIESFGLAVAEALASGAPVIAYESGAAPEMIGDRQTGWLVPVGRVELLAETIIETMDDPAKTYCMGLAGRDSIARRYSWSFTVNQMLTEIERLRNL